MQKDIWPHVCVSPALSSPSLGHPNPPPRPTMTTVCLDPQPLAALLRQLAWTFSSGFGKLQAPLNPNIPVSPETTQLPKPLGFHL